MPGSSRNTPYTSHTVKHNTTTINCQISHIATISMIAFTKFQIHLFLAQLVVFNRLSVEMVKNILLRNSNNISNIVSPLRLT